MTLKERAHPVPWGRARVPEDTTAIAPYGGTCGGPSGGITARRGCWRWSPCPKVYDGMRNGAVSRRHEEGVHLAH